MREANLTALLFPAFLWHCPECGRRRYTQPEDMTLEEERDICEEEGLPVGPLPPCVVYCSRCELLFNAEVSHEVDT